MINEYLKAKKLSPYDQSLLLAGVNTNIVQEYAAGAGSLSADYYDQVKSLMTRLFLYAHHFEFD